MKEKENIQEIQMQEDKVKENTCKRTEEEWKMILEEWILEEEEKQIKMTRKNIKKKRKLKERSTGWSVESCMLGLIFSARKVYESQECISRRKKRVNKRPKFSTIICPPMEINSVSPKNTKGTKIIKENKHNCERSSAVKNFKFSQPQKPVIPCNKLTQKSLSVHPKLFKKQANEPA